jgi:hypothetical protein
VLHTPQVCANGTWPMSSFIFIILLFTTTIDLRLMGTSPDEDLISYVHVAHGLEVSSQANTEGMRYNLVPSAAAQQKHNC